MNETKIIPIIINSFKKEKDNSEESYEDCQIIKEDYCSSPRCGIKSKIVTKSVEKIIFSPIEISTNPYFKYCVTPVKDDHFKYDFSQSETNHTRNQEEKGSKKNVNNNKNFLKTSYLENNKNELKEEKNESGIEEENENISNYLNLVFKKENEINLNLNDEDNSDSNNDNESKEDGSRNKNKKISLCYNDENNNVSDNQNGVLRKEQRKYSLNGISENNEENKKDKNSQKNMHNLLVLNNDNKKNRGLDLETNNFSKNKSKVHSIFQTLRLKKDNIKNVKKKISPFKIVKDKKNPIVIASQTTTNINRFKKTKKSKEEIQKTKTTNFFKEQLIINKNSKDKRVKKLKNKNNESDNSDENIKLIKRGHSNNNNNCYINKSKKITSHKKMESIGDNKSAINSKINNKKLDSDEKNNENETFKKRKGNHFGSYRLKMNDNLKKEGTPKTVKRNKTIRPESFNFKDSKKTNNAFSARKERENVINKKKSNFINMEEGNNNNEKKEIKDNKEKENSVNIKKVKTKEKKEKKKNKKKEKYKQKEKEKEKIRDKSSKKYSAKNLKLFMNDPNKENKFNFNITKRKDKSLTLICKNKNNNILLRESAKKLSIYNSINFSEKRNLKSILRRMNSREISSKNNMLLNLEPTKKIHRPRRRNSTKIIHNNSHKEKITAYTNKQNIENINDYTRQCLEIIPDLYELKEIPRCKTKIHPNFKKTKKIALYDLDETIVHCIGEINMNNVENFTRQSDAKIKVLLPGGKEVTIGINVRPHWEEALNIIKDKYHIIAYTASHESYADSVLNYLDPDKKYFEYRLYRSHCVLCNVNEMKFYVKDLGILEEFCDLKDVVLIDNSVLSFAYHLDNGIPISPFYDSKVDMELLDISYFLVRYADENDIRNKLREVYKLTEYLEIIKNNKSDDSISDSSSISVVEEDEEGEKTNKNVGNGKITTFALFANGPQEGAKIDDENKEGENKQKEEYKKSNKSLVKKGNSSQKNLNISKISQILEKKDIYNKKRSQSFCHREKKYRKFDSKRISDFMNNIKSVNINKSFGAKKKNKFKSFRYFDINFQKEWDEMKRELSK